MAQTTRLPVIDIAGLRSPDRAERARIAGELGRACREVGFFYATGHGVGAATLGTVFAQSRHFFALDLVAKQALSMARIGNNRGYSALGDERLDPDAPPDHKESFNIGLEFADGDPRAAEPFRGPNAWPDLPGWRQTMLEFYQTCLAIGRLIHQGFSLDLGLAERFFDDKLDQPIATLRLLRYPAPEPLHAAATAGDPAAPGAGSHTDYGNLTILAVDGVAGLEVRRRDGVWLAAPHIEGAFICNIGDCLMRWSNDVYVSTPHRVVVPARERYSIAFFLDPNPDAPVAPVVGRGETAHYPPTTGGAFLQSRLDPTYAHRAAVPPG